MENAEKTIYILPKDAFDLGFDVAKKMDKLKSENAFLKATVICCGVAIYIWLKKDKKKKEK